MGWIRNGRKKTRKRENEKTRKRENPAFIAHLANPKLPFLENPENTSRSDPHDPHDPPLVVEAVRAVTQHQPILPYRETHSYGLCRFRFEKGAQRSTGYEVRNGIERSGVDGPLLKVGYRSGKVA